MTAFDSIAGNEHIKRYLTRMLETKALGSSLLFAGPDGVGKSLFAQSLAKLVLGAESHPDLHVYRPEGKIGMHSINTMRQFSEDVYLAPFNGNWKVFIIQDAERMLPYSANALLKTFEEPAKDSIIILISSMPEALLPTILSRCRTIHFQALTEGEIAGVLKEKYQIDDSQAQKIAAASQGSLGHALRLHQGGGNEIREMVLNILSKGKMGTYNELSQAAENIAGKVDELKKKVEENARQERVNVPQEYLTAVQVQGIEKELEGAVSMRMMHDAQALFDVILAWYRDLQLLCLNGKRSMLINRDFEQQMEQSLQRGEHLPLEAVQKAISQARLSLERSTGLNLCLETLFLQLNLL